MKALIYVLVAICLLGAVVTGINWNFMRMFGFLVFAGVMTLGAKRVC